MKRVLISTVVSRWIEVPNDADEETILFETDGLYDGIDLDMYNATDFEIIEVEEDEQDNDEGATYEWFMSLDKTAQSEWLGKVRSHGNPFFQTDQDIIDSLPKEAAE
jgi:hypothetical protein